MKDYRETLNLPRTEFPMRAQLPKREPEILGYWDKIDIYGQVLRQRRGAPQYILHDGPPYANNDIHMGTALNKVLKDFVVKYKTMRGFDSPYVPGWDTHGLPIEHQIIKTRGINRKEVSPIEFRRMCREYALEYVGIQREQFRRLGVRGCWEDPYLTLAKEYEARQISVFGEMVSKGYIYKGLRPVYWCPDCETALAEAEVEYADHRADSIYVKFPVIDDRGLLGGTEGAYCIIWTTTAWTIPANLAICLHPDLDYVLAEAGDEKYLLAEGLLESVSAELGGGPWKVRRRFKGRELEGIVCRHPLFDRESPLILGQHVTLEQGTGCVHTAPGHGLEDYEVGRLYRLPVLSPIDDRGHFTGEAGEFAGMSYADGGEAVIRALEREGVLLNASSYEHQYPHCWRCKEPVLFRATEQWFASIDGFRKEALEAVRKVKWTPSWGEERIHNMIAERQDWCISRQRIWGVPIPIFYCEGCGEAIIDPQVIEAVARLFAREGSDAWYAREAAEILPPGFKCPECGGGSFRKESDTMDVWFDSGTSHFAVLEGRPGLRWPADLYLEGSDQYRGWFHSSLLTAVAVRGEPPYRAVLSHGWVVDGEGRKMSKSLGNVIAPSEIIEEYGADILRLWVASADYTSDIHLSPEILKQLSEVYRKIRNTCRFLLGNCFDFDFSKEAVDYRDLSEFDRWVLQRLNRLIKRVTQAYEECTYHIVYQALHNFCTVDLSNFYLDVQKDRLYCSAADDPARRAVQTVMMTVLESLTRLMAPVLSFTAEEIWQQLPGERLPSVQLAGWPEADPAWDDPELERRWDELLAVRGEATRVLEEARREKLIRSSLEAALTVWAEGDLYRLLEQYREQLAEIFIVSSVELCEGLNRAPAGAQEGQELPLKMTVKKAPAAKCPRCWIYAAPAEGELCPRCHSLLNT
ncbi:MAG TPA: isoleucine--tRNA ligase [Bacillota bacterium]|jgi:isoleucyl-tRNA synthetase|nr:isoleucine--tRNA ligase [Bacillota bacterium]HOA35129.1 isoleucine--tRNA ligase [Bacillota bacterium]HOL15408.1 isoleucine--tRNA ligase [Bacillota bacterium]HPZ11629.1 isoleucine--tRNA ligase [Bacillota bacterium]HQE09482.1 isoleucine--tRNA ligase [Bacillota bacterium]